MEIPYKLSVIIGRLKQVSQSRLPYHVVPISIPKSRQPRLVNIDEAPLIVDNEDHVHGAFKDTPIFFLGSAEIFRALDYQRFEVSIEMHDLLSSFFKGLFVL